MSTMAILITAPWLSLIFGGIFLWMWRKCRAVLTLIAALAWLSYGVYESLHYLRILCSGECNIRVDLLVIYPLLALISLLALVAFYWKGVRTRPDSTNE